MTTTWWGILILCFVCLCLLLVVSALLYRQFFKRFYDILLSALALIVLSPILLILIIVGAIVMKGNPFFTQLRPGKNEKIFKLIKFRTMTNARDKDGNLLPDDKRLTKYGKFLRSTSLDELPEIINIFIGNMSIIGPRPLLVEYLPLYNEEQKHRHDVRPGLTGLAQVRGRNSISWTQKFKIDVEYVNKITLWQDVKIFFGTIFSVLKRDGISQEGNATMEPFRGNEEILEEKAEEKIEENIEAR
ncbi:MAG: sugar transferase [Clostridia bacterium]|nr:sugar transferase [Clostridia bacterium]